MKIAIIGGSSFIGKCFLSHIQKAEKHSQNKSNFLIFGASNALKNNFTIPYNFPRQKLNYNILLECDIIINFSAIGLNGVNKRESELLYELNLFEPIRLAHYLDLNKFKGKLISFGSSHEIGINYSNEAFDEKQLLSLNNSCFNDYGLSKRLLSSFINNCGLEIKWTHLILPNVYGTQFEPSHRIIPYLLKSITNNSSLKLNNIDNTRQFLHVFDLCELLEIIIESSKPLNGIYNVSPEEHFTIRELVLLIEKIFSTPYSNRKEFLEKENDGNYLLLDGRKLKNTLLWEPKRLIKKEIYLFKKLSAC